MCGIAGIIGHPGSIRPEVLKRMTDEIAHRGPDGDGNWVAADSSVGLGHRRLAIIDLSDAGKQPMFYANGRYSITFNGEIYNYVELREELVKEGVKFVSHSDTEVLLALFDKKKEKCLDSLDGMFAFAIWDEKEKRLFCARDRFGEKPFYYSDHEGKLYFASEMKALWSVGVPRVVNNRMLFNYLTNSLVYNPHDLTETFFEKIYKLKAAHYFFLTPGDISPRQIRYWDIDPTYVDDSITEEQACERFRELFDTSVERRLRSDVPVGSSLSGGLDSSLIVCTIDKLNKGRVPQSTFSARFPGFAKDEGKYMDLVIASTNVDPHFVIPDEDGLANDLNKLFYHQEEPFGSASIYAQFCVMRLAKENDVTVLMDGQGADELLAGYHHYFRSFYRELKPGGNGKLRDEKLAFKKVHGTSGGSSRLKSVLVGTLPDSLQTSARALRQRLHYSFFPFLDRRFSREFEKDSYARDITPSKTLNESLYTSACGGSLEELLRYADRNSMAHSREIRLAFLNDKLAKFLFSLPSHMKIRSGITKFVMRRAFSDVLPDDIANRQDKIGYEPPQGQWMGKSSVRSSITKAEEQLIAQRIIHNNYRSNLGKLSLDHAYTEHNVWKILMAGALVAR